MKWILVIDDEKIIRDYIREALETEGYMIIDAPDGKAGLMLLTQYPCDLVITDIYMPNKEGFETIRILKSDYPNVKILAISGGGIGDVDVWKMSKDFGADDSLQKPLAVNELLNTVSGLIGGA